MESESNSTTGADVEDAVPSCEFIPSEFLAAQHWLIAVFGSTVCVIGIGSNIALLQVLFQPKQRSTYLIYLAVLAILDILILISYLVVPVVGVLYEYYKSYFLYRLWHSWVPYFYALTRIVLLASTYLMLACTVERYWEVIQLHKPSPEKAIVSQKRRYLNIACVLLGTVAFRFTVLFELTIEKHPECDGTMAYVTLDRTDLVKNNYFYAEIYSFWAVHFAQVFFPFPVLVLLNILIILGWRSVLRNRRKQSLEMKRLIERSHSARQMMVSLVTSYLIFNTLQVVITIWEHVSMDFLNDHRDFYAFAADVVTLLTAINASTRLPIYYATNMSIRLAIQELWLSKKVQDLVYVGSFKSFRSLNSIRRSVKRKRARAETDNGQENSCMMTYA